MTKQNHSLPARCGIPAIIELDREPVMTAEQARALIVEMRKIIAAHAGKKFRFIAGDRYIGVDLGIEFQAID